MPRYIEFPPLPGTENEQWFEVSVEFGIDPNGIKEIVGPASIGFNKGLLDKNDIRKILINKGYTPKKAQPEKEWREERDEWLEKHPFTNKWLNTCHGTPGKASPVYERPKYAEIIKEEEINIENDMSKETREIKIEGNSPLGEARDQLPVGTNINWVEVNKPLTDLDEYEDDTVTEQETDEYSVLKEYQKDIIENNAKRRFKKSVLTPDEEAELKKKFNKVRVDEFLTRFENWVKERWDSNYVPGEDIDTSKKINDVEMIRTMAKVFGCDKYFEPVDRVKQQVDCYEKPECTVSDIWSPEEENLPKSIVGTLDKNSFDAICLGLMDLHRRKNKDYGNAADASFKEFGITSYLIRLNDKLNRLKSLTKPGTTMEVKDESIIDTLKDLAAYSIMAVESLLNQ